MRLLLITPLYPPDISEPAPYVKELATRLSGTHEVTVLAYNHIPEGIPGVTILSIEKTAFLPLRLYRFTRALITETQQADVLYAQNGPSVELPLLLLTYLTKTPLFFRLGDLVPLRHALTRPFLRSLVANVLNRARHVIVHEPEDQSIRTLIADIPNEKYSVLMRPCPRPEILPLVPYPYEAFAAYEASWDTHALELSHLFSS